MERQLLKQLTARQGAMSDSEFARILGIPRVTWTHTRTARIPVGRRVAFGVLRAFPDLLPLTVAVLLTERPGGAGGETAE